MQRCRGLPSRAALADDLIVPEPIPLRVTGVAESAEKVDAMAAARFRNESAQVAGGHLQAPHSVPHGGAGLRHSHIWVCRVV